MKITCQFIWPLRTRTTTSKKFYHDWTVHNTKPRKYQCNSFQGQNFENLEFSQIFQFFIQCCMRQESIDFFQNSIGRIQIDSRSWSRTSDSVVSIANYRITLIANYNINNLYSIELKHEYLDQSCLDIWRKAIMFCFVFSINYTYVFFLPYLGHNHYQWRNGVEKFRARNYCH